MAHSYGPKGKIEGNAFERGCEGKVGFETEAGATAGMKFYQKIGALRTNDGMTVYKCDFCPKWHFGH